MTALSDLDASFIRVRMEPASDCRGRKLPDGSTQWGGFPVETIHRVPHRLGAHGLQLDCPACGDHKVQLFFRGEDVPGAVGRNARGAAVRWDVTGEGIATVSLTPSILVRAACNTHFWIRDGEVFFA